MRDRSRRHALCRLLLSVLLYFRLWAFLIPPFIVLGRSVSRGLLSALLQVCSKLLLDKMRLLRTFFVLIGEISIFNL